MVRGGPASWNIRDRHMMETLERLMRAPRADGEGDRLGAQHPHRRRPRHRHGRRRDGQHRPARARAERQEGVVLVGFGSHRGSVIAGEEWDAPMERMPVPPAREGSWEDVLHRAGASDKLLLLTDGSDAGRLPGAARPSRHRRRCTIRPTSGSATTCPTVLPAATTRSCTSTRRKRCTRFTCSRERP